MPGITPSCARPRKQIQQRSNLLYTARGRPQRLQRVYLRTLNRGSRFAFATSDFLAKVTSWVGRSRQQRNARVARTQGAFVAAGYGRD
jgi:hypothetical protein